MSATLPMAGSAGFGLLVERHREQATGYRHHRPADQPLELGRRSPDERR